MGCPPILGDAHQLQQVFINILSNARQAIQTFRRDGEVQIRTEFFGSLMRLSIADNGPGIRPEHLSRIFDPFFTTKPVGKGTGLGMSLSYGIVREHGGSIRVQSEAGRGATFLIELPAASAGGQLRNGIASTVQRSPGRRPGAEKSVLVVDDEESILALTGAILREDGYGVETITSGELAVERVARNRFDVIVCDWKMPGLNGIQLFEHFCAKDAVSASRMRS